MPGESTNVLVIVLEGARADHTGCYGYELQTTPFLDDLARQGVRFANASSTAATALPAVASLLTGLFPRAHGATEESGVLPAGPRTLAERLRGAGYRTAAFSAAATVSPETGCDRGFESVDTGSSGGRRRGRAAAYARRASDRVLGRADCGARRTAAALSAWAQAGQEPFFALAHFSEAGTTTPPPAPYDRAFATAAVDERCARHDGALRYFELRPQDVALALGARWDRTLAVLTATHGAALTEEASGLGPDTLRVPLLRDGTVTSGPGWAFAEHYRVDCSEVRTKAVRSAREQFVWRSDEQGAYFSLVKPWRGNQIDTQRARADALRRALFTWLPDTEQWMRRHGFDAMVDRTPAAARRAAVE